MNMFPLCTQDLAGTHLCAAGPCCSGRRGVVADGQLEGFLARPLPHQRAGILHHRRPRLPPHLLLQAHQLFRNRSVGLLRSFVAISSRVSLIFICFFFGSPLFQVEGCASQSSRPVCSAAALKEASRMTCRQHPGTRAPRAHLSDTTPS